MAAEPVQLKCPRIVDTRHAQEPVEADADGRATAERTALKHPTLDEQPVRVPGREREEVGVDADDVRLRKHVALHRAQRRAAADSVVRKHGPQAVDAARLGGKDDVEDDALPADEARLVDVADSRHDQLRCPAAERSLRKDDSREHGENDELPQHTENT